ncbi:MAG: TetR/AcrR family transcriptional regulator [Deltaproteobacteria bacterium]|nr:TetR/AcrR family transcriptional regulator [Deltaproteobacteria bacterium]
MSRAKKLQPKEQPIEGKRAGASHPSLRDETRAIFRAAVLRAAEDVFAEKGYHGARIQDIAARARIAVGTVYNYFKEKDEILDALLREQGEQISRAFMPRADDPADFESRFRTRVLRLFAFMQEHRTFFSVAAQHGVFDPEHAEEVMKSGARRNMPGQLEELLREGAELGVLRKDNPQRLVRFLGGAMRATLMGALRDDATDLRDEGMFVIDMFLRGARATKPNAPRKTRSSA